MKNITASLLVFLFLQGCAAPTKKPTINPTKPSDFAVNKPSSYELLDHGIFKVYYDIDKRMARYVAYQLTAEKLKQKVAKRKNSFKADPLLIKRNLPYVKPSEYKGSGYDQGHLAPAADFSFSQEASNTTFVMSNMAPQEPTLNRGVWKKLEDKIRKWGCGEEKITVITGPIFTNPEGSLASGLMIPNSFFKIVFDETPPVKMVAFIFKQHDVGDVINQRRVSIEEVEKQTMFKIASLIPESSNLPKRLPAELNEWKEADCD